jgi:hypothetical protein
VTPKRRVGNAPGVYFGPYASGRLDVVFRVLGIPDDAVVGLPLFNVGAEFNVVDVAGMVLDGALTDGTRLRYADGTHWLVRSRELHQIDGSRRMRPRETSKTEHIARLVEVTE